MIVTDRKKVLVLRLDLGIIPTTGPTATPSVMNGCGRWALPQDGGGFLAGSWQGEGRPNLEPSFETVRWRAGS